MQSSSDTICTAVPGTWYVVLGIYSSPGSFHWYVREYAAEQGLRQSRCTPKHTTTAGAYCKAYTAVLVVSTKIAPGYKTQQSAAGSTTEQ